VASIPPSEQPVRDETRLLDAPVQEDPADTCERVADALASYAAQELPDQERTRVKRHLSCCSQCRREVEEYRAVIDLAQTLPPPVPPPAVEERLRRFLAEAVRTRAGGGLDETKVERPLS
jgi:hypothetical protein